MPYSRSAWSNTRKCHPWDRPRHDVFADELGGDLCPYRKPKPQWEFPRLCRGGSKSLTYPAVDTAAPSTKLRMVSRVIDGHERLSHTK
jgi:hypothetical protein